MRQSLTMGPLASFIDPFSEHDTRRQHDPSLADQQRDRRAHLAVIQPGAERVENWIAFRPDGRVQTATPV